MGGRGRRERVGTKGETWMDQEGREREIESNADEHVTVCGKIFQFGVRRSRRVCKANSYSEFRKLKIFREDSSGRISEAAKSMFYNHRPKRETQSQKNSY